MNDENENQRDRDALNWPVLRNWRLIHGVLVGEVEGHPLIDDGWLISSKVEEIAGDKSWARTESRYYRLQHPFRDSEEMPPGATDVVLQRILGNAGTFTEEQFATYVELAEKLTGRLN